MKTQRAGVMIFWLIITLLFAGVASAVLIDQIVATVNGEIITLYDLYKAELPVFGKILLPDEYDIKNPEDRTRELLLLNKLIEERIIVQRARQRGLSVGNDEIDEAIEKTKLESNLTEEMFETALMKRGLSMEEYHQRISRQILVSKVINNEIHLKLVISPEEIQKYYQDHLEKFITADRVKMRHILILADEEDGSNEKRNLAEKVLSLLESGKDFEETARQYSEDSSTYKGEISGYINRGDVLPELEEVIFSLKEGQISSVIESKLGFHIIKIENSEISRRLPLEEVSREIEKTLFKEKGENRYKAWLEEIKEQASIDIRL